MSFVESKVDFGKSDSDHFVARNNKTFKVNDIASFEGVLTTLEHVFGDIRVHRDCQLILAIVIIDIESINKSFQLNCRLRVLVFALSIDKAVSDFMRGINSVLVVERIYAFGKTLFRGSLLLLDGVNDLVLAHCWVRTNLKSLLLNSLSVAIQGNNV